MSDIDDIDAGLTVKIVGSDSTGVEQIPVQSDSEGRLHTLTKHQDNYQLDAFGRLRISHPSIIFESNFVNSDKPTFFTEKINSGGLIVLDTNNASMNLTTNTTNTSRAVRQTKKYFHFVSGNGLLLFLAGKFGAGKTNCVQRIGYFDDNNGVFFELDGTTFNVVLRSDTSGIVVETRIPQSSFNINKLDGTGLTSHIFDATKQQVFSIDFQGSGTGRVRLAVNNGQRILHCHEFTNVNTSDSVYMRTGSLPIRYEIVNTGITASPTTLRMTSVSIIDEGVRDKPAIMRSVDRGVIEKTVGGTFLPIIAIRLKSQFIRATIIPKFLSLGVLTSDIVAFRLILNPTTLTGANWSSAAVDSIAEFDTSATQYTGGMLVRTFYLGDKSAETPALDDSEMSIGSDIDGNSDILLVACAGAGVNANVIAAINFLEDL